MINALAENNSKYTKQQYTVEKTQMSEKCTKKNPPIDSTNTH